MTEKEKIVNLIEHLTEKMKNEEEESTFFKHMYSVEIKYLEESLKRLEEEKFD